MLNKVILIGRMGGDPEVRETNNGTPVANFNLATDESYTKDGEKQKQTTWHRLILWDKLAGIAEKYLGKGDLIYVEGRLQVRTYEDKRDGAEKTVTEIVVNQLKMLQTKCKDSDSDQTRPAQSNQRAQQRSPQQRPAQREENTRNQSRGRQQQQTREPGDEIGDEDIPF